MCGIVGYFSTGRPLELEKLKAAVHSLVHRGPDGQSQWQSADKLTSLGHARLSIIDLHTGAQPLFSQDQSIVCVVNGEFYGFKQIRKELQGLGYRFNTESDSEVLIPLYQEYGEACFQHLRGEFAFLLYDKNKKVLLAGRDRFGIKPLFFSQLQSEYYFASEIKALFKLGVPAQWDQDSFYESIHFMGASNQKQTLFNNIGQIQPGHYLKITPQNSELISYWDFNYPTQSELNSKPRSDQEYIEGLRALLEESVQLRLHADVPVAGYLSGGLDSCSVLGLAAKLTGRPVTTFTLGFDSVDYDESAVAQEMAKKAGLVYNHIPIQASMLGEHFEAAIYHCESMMINPHGISKYLLSKAVRDAGFKVVLTGEGADEILAGYAHFRMDMLLNNHENQDQSMLQDGLQVLANTNKVSKGLLISSEKTDEIESIKSKLGCVPSWIKAFAPGARFFKSFLKDEFLLKNTKVDAYENFLRGLSADQQLVKRDPVNQSLYLWSKRVLPNYILSILGDRMEMAHSIEGRVPFLDHKVVEYVKNMPIPMKIRGLTEKFVLREALRPELTDTVYKRQKHPFLAPPITADKSSSLHTMMQDLLRGSGIDNLPFIDIHKVLNCLDELPNMQAAERATKDPILTALMSAVILQKKFQIA